MMGFHDTSDTRVQNLYLRSKTTLLLHKSTQSVINSLIIFFKEGSSQLREWLRDCVRDCWQPVWKIFQLWWIGRLLISRWVFVVSRLNYPGLGLPWLSRSIGPITELGWEESSNKITPFRHPTCIQKCEEKSFWTPPCKQSLVESTCTGFWQYLTIMISWWCLEPTWTDTCLWCDTWHTYCVCTVYYQVSHNNNLMAIKTVPWI